MSDNMREGRDFREANQTSSQESDSRSSTPTQPNIKLSEEERQVLRDCNRESFYYRCVPLGVLCIGTSQILVNKGILKPHPKFGALLKNLAAGLFAYVIGKVSYQGRCREMIMQLENSPLAESMRKGKRGQELMRDLASYQPSGPGEVETKQKNEGLEKGDFRRSDYSGDGKTYEYKGLDDNKRPSLDRERSLYEKPKVDGGERQSQSYDDLRAQNRKDYERKMNASHSTSKTPSDQSHSPRQTVIMDDSERSSQQKGIKRNQYGDVIEK